MLERLSRKPSIIRDTSLSRCVVQNVFLICWCQTTSWESIFGTVNVTISLHGGVYTLLLRISILRECVYTYTHTYTHITHTHTTCTHARERKVSYCYFIICSVLFISSIYFIYLLRILSFFLSLSLSLSICFSFAFPFLFCYNHRNVQSKIKESLLNSCIFFFLLSFIIQMH